jgi:hypothetical protein
MAVLDYAPQIPQLAPLAPLASLSGSGGAGVAAGAHAHDGAAATGIPVATRRSPPAPAKKSDKIPPPPPPHVIRDTGKGVNYRRAGFLGEVSLDGLLLFLFLCRLLCIMLYSLISERLPIVIRSSRFREKKSTEEKMT